VLLVLLVLLVLMVLPAAVTATVTMAVDSPSTHPLALTARSQPEMPRWESNLRRMKPNLRA
jgi:hypothetical protein